MKYNVNITVNADADSYPEAIEKALAISKAIDGIAYTGCVSIVADDYGVVPCAGATDPATDAPKEEMVAESNAETKVEKKAKPKAKPAPAKEESSEEEPAVKAAPSSGAEADELRALVHKAVAHPGIQMKKAKAMLATFGSMSVGGVPAGKMEEAIALFSKALANAEAGE